MANDNGQLIRDRNERNERESAAVRSLAKGRAQAKDSSGNRVNSGVI